MSVFARHRNTLIACAALLAAPAAFAAAPSSRTATRMAYDAKTSHMILFGGSTKVDSGTRQSYDLADTWEWNGDRWIQRYPAHSPKGRSFHTMAYDSNHNHTVLFGGKAGTTITNAVEFNDTWTFDGNDWTEVVTPNSPQARIYPGSVFHPLRDRVILFGGTNVSADGKTTTNLYDTWEFDGTTWKQTSTTGPVVIKPMLTYDSSRNRVLLVGTDDKAVTVMYTYDPVAATWNPLTPATLPTCALDAEMAYQSHNDTVVLFGGVCSTSTIAGDTWEFDGTTWKKVADAADPDRLASEAFAYDESRQQTMLFGGTLAFGNPTGATQIYKDHVWKKAVDPRGTPAPRSLFAFVSNPDQQLVWLIGGMNDNGLGGEFWQFKDGVWSALDITGGPSVCGTPNGAYDSDRKKLVVVCADSSTLEWDGTAWKTITGLKTTPTQRGFSSMTYDSTIKKTVLFGGDVGGGNYLDQTWTWDGATWTRVKKNPPTSRALAAMWFDPTLKKTVIFGGVGRKTTEDRIERPNDMWSFDGTAWTQIKNVATLPSARYGAQTAVDPRTGKVLLFGGLTLEVLGATQNQFYANDLWQWDGTTWTKVSTNGTPPPRENGGIAYDPSIGQMVLFAGYSGFYLSDLWMLDTKNNWTVKAEAVNPPVVIPPRRRAVH
jgi:hypothetical protein